jgi:hypothetical protein
MRRARTRARGRRADLVAAFERSLRRVAECGGPAGADGVIGGGGCCRCSRYFLQHCREVERSGDQEVVEAFAAQGYDPAFRDRVRARCPHRDVDNADVGASEHGVEGRGELAARSRIKNRYWLAWSLRSMSRLPACWVIPGSGRVGGDRGDVHAGGCGARSGRAGRGKMPLQQRRSRGSGGGRAARRRSTAAERYGARLLRCACLAGPGPAS